MINVLIADDHKIVLDGLSSIISSHEQMSVVCEATNGRQVLDMLATKEVDVAVLDIEMPELNGVELTKIMVDKYPQIRILILTMYNEIGFIRRVIEAGAHGYVLKEHGKYELIEAILKIHSGEEYFGVDVANTLISSMKSTTINGEIKLTKREIEVLKLIANGKTTPIISNELFIAHTTVETHRRNLIEKTGVSNSKGLVKFAIENGYV